ncbi:MAG: tripartite tricarboxylate transporter substrate binding protein [Pseudomonadota bacterium]|uniref:Bug family tripartite tricarboxylate transporter substrate binding protein n=1 Tax=Polaromonas sp. TaxID=1869339 RepID=UPI0017C79462|nr:tripartite tricarboxylate transporter substrate binding protein [Polaromonas sp.]MBA3592353.1 tripartite tricarboxylate transporter substrate binding protein [Polaromonas sp.]MDQ3271166.1 tripartite tricarboxylate transporter substrate binding protein [Pseudomonadota bacterium]
MINANRRLLSALLGSLSLAGLPVLAQPTWPGKPIRLVIPFPGGFTDNLGRLVGQKMGESLGQPLVIEQRPGGSGQIAASEVLRSPADGYTLFMIHIGTHAINQHLLPKLSYDATKDFIPVTELARVPNLLVATPTLPVRSVQDLVALAKAKPGSLFYASPGNGSSGHLAGELFKSLAGVDIVHVPYKGASESLQDLLTGRVHIMFDSLAQGGPQARAAKVQGLAVTSTQRHSSFPEFPTMAESGFPGWNTGPWFGLAVKSGTPDEIVRRLQIEAARALATPSVRERLAALGATPGGSTPEEFAGFIKNESERWGKLVREVPIKPE